MSVDVVVNKHDQLLLALAEGKSVRSWARANDVPKSTAIRWASSPAVRRQLEDWRRCCLDEALGKFTEYSMHAVDTIIGLGIGAGSESVRLSAAKAVLREQIALAKYVDRADRGGEAEQTPDHRELDIAPPLRDAI